MDDKSTCRTCTRRQKSNVMLPLDSEVKSSGKPNLRSMLEKCIPGMMLNSTKNPVICPPCVSKLEICYEFITNCHQVEKIISSHLEQSEDPTCGTIDLFDVVNKSLGITREIKTEPETDDDEYNDSRNGHGEFNVNNMKMEHEVTDRATYSNQHAPNDLDTYREDIVAATLTEAEEKFTLPETTEQDTSEDNGASPVYTSESETDNDMYSEKSSKKDYRKRNFRCDKCLYKAYSMELLENHRAYKCKRNVKFHQCEECEYRTPRLHAFRRHTLTHGGERPFVCPQCNKGFVEQCQFRQHVLLHSGEGRPHSCPECGAGFARKWDLKMHLERHTGQKRYQCTKRLQCGRCTRQFSDKRTLEAHEMRHQGRHKYQCQLCDFATSYKKNLARHTENKHP